MIYFASVVIVLISYFQFKNVAGTMAINRLNILSVIFYFYLIFVSYIGTVFIANGFGDNPALNHVSSENKLFGWLAISYVMISFPFGVFLAKKLFNIKKVKLVLDNYVFADLKPLVSKKDSYFRMLLYVLSFFCLLSVLYMIFVTGKVPQAELFNLTSQTEVLLLRTNISRDFEGIYAIKSIFFETLTPILSFISYCYFTMTKKIQDRLWFILMLMLTLFVLTFSLSKSPLIVYGITFLILKIYLKGYVAWKPLIATFIIAFIGIVVMFFLISRSADSSVVLSFLFNRVFFDQISGTFLMFEIFPSYNDFIGFTSMSKPVSNLLLGGYSQPATRLAMEYAFPVATEQGLMNLLSTLFVGEAWANFGWVGLFISPIYVGFLIGTFFYFIITTKKTPILVVFLAYCSFGVSLSTQFNNYLYNSGMFTIFFVFFSSYVVALFLKQLKIN